jgi:hypothetical protein
LSGTRARYLYKFLDLSRKIDKCLPNVMYRAARVADATCKTSESSRAADSALIRHSLSHLAQSRLAIGWQGVTVESHSQGLKSQSIAIIARAFSRRMDGGGIT